jgi:hypothetical protein
MPIFDNDPEFDDWETEYEPDEPEALFGRRRRRPSPASPTRPYAPPRPGTGNTISRQEFQQALAGVRTDMQRNATAIRAVGDQITSLATRTRQEIAGLRTESRGGSQLMNLLPLLATPTPITTTGVDSVGGVSVPVGTRIARAPDPMMTILPLLLSSGMGGQGTGGQSGQGMDQSAMLVLALAMMRPQTP